eukprot:scaffold1717_cov169-Amphora_coffeaeformis.AAC.9
MVGYWSGYLMDDQDSEEPPELVILEMEKIADDLVEPKIHLPEEAPLPIWVRSMVVGMDGSVKLVLDDGMGDSNAIFKGQLDGGRTIKGMVYYDDTDFTPPLVLKWSPDEPRPIRDVEK